MSDYKIFYSGDLRQVYSKFKANSDEEAIAKFKSFNVNYLVLYRTQGRKKLYKLDFVYCLHY